jgi:hypothetical protein
VRYLVDGHNLIARLPGLGLDDPHDEARLVRRLRAWALASRKRQLTIIFDGRLAGGRSAELSGGSVEVIFSPHGGSADELLLRRIKKARNPAEYTVISSDREILAAAEARRMPSMVSEAFVLFMAEETSRPAPAPADNELEVSPAEISEWLALFGPVPERPAAPIEKALPPPAEPEKPAKKTGRLATFKEGDKKLAPDEVSAWLEVFREAPATPPAAPAPPANEPQKPGAAPELGRPLPTPKAGGRKLDDDEITGWLELFSRGKPPEPK